MKKSDTTKDQLDDDNNTDSPAYIPRKGRFYEHDDRTLNENDNSNDRSKDETAKKQNRSHRDSDRKWQHDLYFQEEKLVKPRNLITKRNVGRFQNSSQYYQEKHDLKHHRSQSENARARQYPEWYHSNYVQRFPREISNLAHENQKNNIDSKYHIRSSSHNRNDYRKDRNNTEKDQGKSLREARHYDSHKFDDHTYRHKKNYFPQENVRKSNNNHFSYTKKLSSEQFNKTSSPYDKRNSNGYDLSSRFQSKMSISNDIFNNERSKRYSNMRNGITNSNQQSSSFLQRQNVQDQRLHNNTKNNNNEKSDWPQAPPPPTSYLPPTLITPQMYYQQTSRYVKIDNSDKSISQTGYD